MKSRSLAAAVALALTSGTPAMATPDFVNGLTIPASTTDLSGDPNSINQRLGMFSDIYYDPNRNEWWALSDRGAGGGTLPYDTRVQRFQYSDKHEVDDAWAVVKGGEKKVVAAKPQSVEVTPVRRVRRRLCRCW